MGTQMLMMTNTDLSKENRRKNQKNTVFVETSKCFPASEAEFKCLMVFFPLLPVVQKGRH